MNSLNIIIITSNSFRNEAQLLKVIIKNIIKYLIWKYTVYQRENAYLFITLRKIIAILQKKKHLNEYMQ